MAPEERENKEELVPPLDFSSIVLPLFTQALVSLGLLADPETGKTAENIKLAQRLIDLLDLLRDRTQGRLKPEEEAFLSSCLSQLKWHYLEKTQYIKG